MGTFAYWPEKPRPVVLTGLFYERLGRMNDVARFLKSTGFQIIRQEIRPDCDNYPLITIRPDVGDLEKLIRMAESRQIVRDASGVCRTGHLVIRDVRVDMEADHGN